MLTILISSRSLQALLQKDASTATLRAEQLATAEGGATDPV